MRYHNPILYKNTFHVCFNHSWVKLIIKTDNYTTIIYKCEHCLEEQKDGHL